VGDRRRSEHCTCLTGSDVTGSHVTFFLTFFSRTFFPYFFPVLFFPYFFPRTFFFRSIFPVFFSQYFFLSSSTRCWLGCSLRRPHPITFYELALSLVIYPFSRHFIFMNTLYISKVKRYGKYGRKVS
jgi:hypothetical protein